MYSGQLIKNLNKANCGLKTSPTQKHRGGETYLLTGGKKKKLLSLNRWLDLENFVISAAAACRAERKQRNLFEKLKKTLDFYQHSLKAFNRRVLFILS